MEYKKNNNVILIRLNKGDEIIESLKLVAQKNNIKSGVVTGIGAADQIEIGLFNTAEKKYYSNLYKGDFEISSLSGNITQMNNKPYIHLHCNIADSDNKVYGGHLNFAIISGTCEICVLLTGIETDRFFDDNVGLNLIRFI